MKEGDYELLSVDEMRKKYGLTAAHRPAFTLDPEHVPEALRHLIPYAELWGVSDDLIRDDVMSKASPVALEDLKRVVKQHEAVLEQWLAGPAAEGPHFSKEYVAFTALLMAADGV